MRADQIYGARSDRHQQIMLLSADELHEQYGFTAELVFNETMTKKEFNEKNVPPASILEGTKGKDDKIETYSWVIGNEQGEILPKFLMNKLVAIESNKVFGKELKTKTSDEQKDRLFAIVREARLHRLSVVPRARHQSRLMTHGEGIAHSLSHTLTHAR